MPDPSSFIRLQPKTALLCDDIRQEISGKTMIIGLYTSMINVFATPETKDALALRLTAWVPLVLESVGVSKFSLRIEGPDDGQFSNMDGEINVVEITRPDLKEITAIHFPTMNFPIKKPGIMRVKFKNEVDSVWQILAEHPVSIVDMPCSGDSPGSMDFSGLGAPIRIGAPK